MTTNGVYAEAGRQFNARSRDVQMYTKCPLSRLSTLKSAFFGSSSSLPPLTGVGGGLVSEGDGKADLITKPLLGVVFWWLLHLGNFPASKWFTFLYSYKLPTNFHNTNQSQHRNADF